MSVSSATRPGGYLQLLPLHQARIATHFCSAHKSARPIGFCRNGTSKANSNKPRGRSSMPTTGRNHKKLRITKTIPRGIRIQRAFGLRNHRSIRATRSGACCSRHSYAVSNSSFLLLPDKASSSASTNSQPRIEGQYYSRDRVPEPIGARLPRRASNRLITGVTVIACNMIEI